MSAKHNLAPAESHGGFPAPDLRGIDGATHSEWRMLGVPAKAMLIQEKDLPEIIKRACLAYSACTPQPKTLPAAKEWTARQGVVWSDERMAGWDACLAQAFPQPVGTEAVAEVRANGANSCELYFLPAGAHLKPGDQLYAYPVPSSVPAPTGELPEVAAWRAAHLASRAASDAYNAALIEAQRKDEVAGFGATRVDAEYQAMVSAANVAAKLVRPMLDAIAAAPSPAVAHESVQPRLDWAVRTLRAVADRGRDALGDSYPDVLQVLDALTVCRDAAPQASQPPVPGNRS